jgi:hypothetical protein
VYDARLKDELTRRIFECENRLLRGEKLYESAYLLAAMYVELKEVPPYRTRIGRLLAAYSRDERTSSAVTQAKHLVRARVAESKMNCDAAIESYESILSIDRQSPIGRYAGGRVQLVRQKKSQKVSGG